MPNRWKLYRIVGACLCTGGFIIFIISFFLSVQSPTYDTGYINFIFVGLLPLVVGIFILDYLDHRPLYLSCKVFFAGVQKDEFPIGPFRGHKAIDDWKNAVSKQINLQSEHPEHITLKAIKFEFTEIPDYDFVAAPGMQIKPWYLVNALNLVQHLINEQYYLPNKTTITD